MKQALLVGLICLNAALVVALVFGATRTTASAQVVGAAGNYVVVTGQIGSDSDAVYVLDLASRRLAAWKWDRTSKRMVALGRGRELARDFGREAGK